MFNKCSDFVVSPGPERFAGKTHLVLEDWFNT